MSKERHGAALICAAEKVSLCAAALCRKEWTELHPGGSELVLRQLESLRNRDGLRSLVCLVPRIRQAERAVEALRHLASKKISIVWIAGWEKAGRIISDAVPGIAVHSHRHGMLDAVKAWRPDLAEHPLVKAIECHSETLLDAFCDYYSLRHLMKDLAVDELTEAIDTLHGLIPRLLRDKALKPKHFPKEIRPSLERQEEGDQVYLSGTSTTMMALKRRITAIGASDLSVMIRGEAGTGKRAVARWIHEFGSRRSRPFASFDCAGLDAHHLRRELFGHGRGLRKHSMGEAEGLLARCDGGTLYLHGIEHLEAGLQCELLEFLRTGRYRPVESDAIRSSTVRLLSGQHVAPDRPHEESNLRKELYYRLAEVIVETPSLRTITEDVPRMARDMAFRLARTPEARARADRLHRNLRWKQPVLDRYPWPGNARELSAMVRRALELDDDVAAELEAMVEGVGSPPSSAAKDAAAGYPLPASPDEIRPLDEVKAAYVKAAHAARGELTQQELAARLGLSVNTLKRWLKA